METGKKKITFNNRFGGGFLAGTLVSSFVLLIVFIFGLEEQRDSFIERLAAGEGSVKTEASADVSLTTDGVINQEFIDKAEMIYSGVVKEFYFDEDIDLTKMHDEMYRGMINSLGDKYAEYYTKAELEEMLNDSEGVYYGIGSYVMMDETGFPILSGVFKDSPAQKAGLRDGDIIYEVNGENLYGLTLTECVNQIKGPENTEVSLTVYRKGEPDYLDITVIRGKVETPTVSYEMKNDEIGYLQITEFDDVTTAQFKEAYKDLKRSGMKAMILDLRSNGGGNLDTVLAIAEEMLPQGIITYTLDKQGNKEEFKSKGKTPVDFPLVVLTNEYTASASELLTGALKDYNLAETIGTNTYGKGIVQTVYPFPDMSGVKFTTSRYYTPNGVCIHETGIAPDIELEFDSELYYGEEAIDNQLEYAIDYLEKKLR